MFVSVFLQDKGFPVGGVFHCLFLAGLPLWISVRVSCYKLKDAGQEAQGMQRGGGENGQPLVGVGGGCVWF